jgi:phospholipid/cholesterol/gamma-HCH transport system substrate-binding protein
VTEIPTARGAARSPAAIWGLVYLAVVTAVFALVFEKTTLLTALRPGETLVAESDRDYKLQIDRSEVKIAGTPVGVVSGIDWPRQGRVEVALKLHPGTVALLGTAPTAQIRPTTILGGTYYVSLKPGGRPGSPAGGRIAASRTGTPVELEQLLEAIPPRAQRSLQRTIGLLDQTLAVAAGPLRELLRTAPDTLAPAAQVLDAARGVRPDTDLSVLVSDLDRTARVLSRRDGQLGRIVDSLAITAAVLARESGPLRDAVAMLPDTLSAAHRGADDLSSILDRVPPTAAAIMPAVAQLNPLMRRLDPALAETRALLDQARPLIADARPMVERLVPASRVGIDVLDDVRGRVLERVNGPILSAVLSGFRGQAPKYPGGTSHGHPLYQELGYMFSNLDGAMKAYDDNGSMISFQPGFGTSSLLAPRLGLSRAGGSR